MNDFENDLRRVLHRREPPRDLTSGVMVRIAKPRPKRFSIFRFSLGGAFPWRPALAAAAAAVVLIAGIDRYLEYRRGLEAKRQVLFALEITAQKLSAVQAKIDELNRRSISHDR